MITIEEVIEQCAEEFISDYRAGCDCDNCQAEAERIRALAAQYEGCIVADGEPYCYMERETLYRAKERNT